MANFVAVYHLTELLHMLFEWFAAFSELFNSNVAFSVEPYTIYCKCLMDPLGGEKEVNVKNVTFLSPRDSDINIFFTGGY